MTARILIRRLANRQVRHFLLSHLTLIFFLTTRDTEDGSDGWLSNRIGGLRSPLDIHNVDLLQAHTEEVRDWLRLFRHWSPDIVMELSDTETANWRARCLFASAPSELLSAPLSALSHRLHVEARSIWQAEHRVLVRAWFKLLNPASPGLGVITTPSRLSDPVPYGALNRTLAFQWIWEGNPRGHHLSTRIWQTLAPWFDLLIRKRFQVLQDIAKARTSTPSDSVVVQLPLSGETVRKLTPFLLHTYAYEETLSPISGTVWVRYHKHQPRNYLVPRYSRPFISLRQSGISGYLVPAIFVHAIHALKQHGIQMKIFHKARTLRVIVYRLKRLRWSIPPKTQAPTIHSYQARPRVRLLTYPPGSIYVPLNQAHSALVVTLLDPESPYNLLYLGYFRNLFDRLPLMHQARLEKIARQLLRTHPQLARRFLHRILDPHFAGNPLSRLDFFYRHLFRDPVSRHYYPVAMWAGNPKGRAPLPSL